MALSTEYKLFVKTIVYTYVHNCHSHKAFLVNVALPLKIKFPLLCILPLC